MIAAHNVVRLESQGSPRAHLAIQAIPLVKLDPELAMEQLLLLTGRRYIHASGALPAYEWNFSDANPPVHAWATWQVYEETRDIAFLRQMFDGLLPNFEFWMARRHANGPRWST